MKDLDLDKLLSALKALKGASPPKRARIKVAVSAAVTKAQVDIRGRAVLAAIEAAERAERARFAPVAHPTHGNVRAGSWEARYAQAGVAEHRINKGEIAWREVVAQCQSHVHSSQECDILADVTLERRLDNIETKRAKRGQMPRI